MSEKKAVIFCSASYDIDPKYNQAAREFVRAACLSGYDIVSGGTVKGTMKVVCDEARKFDVRVVGVLPKFMKGLEYPDVTECIWTDRMSERKDMMREGTDVAILSLGAIGNLAADAVQQAEAQGISVAHYDMRFLKPIDQDILHTVGQHFTKVITLENGVTHGGLGSAVAEFFAANAYTPQVIRLGLPDEFVPHGSVPQQLHYCGLSADDILATIQRLAQQP